jgi:hypothetical protein
MGRWALVAAGAAVAIAAGIYVLRGDETRRVRARVESAAEALSPPAGEADLNRLTRLAGFAKLLAPDVLVEAEPGGASIRGREAVAGLAAQLSAAAGAQRIELSDIEVALDETSTRATVSALVHVTSSSAGNTSTYDGQLIHLELTRIDGDWLISRARPEPALDR